MDHVPDIISTGIIALTISLAPITMSSSTITLFPNETTNTDANFMPKIIFPLNKKNDGTLSGISTFDDQPESTNLQILVDFKGELQNIKFAETHKENLITRSECTLFNSNNLLQDENIEAAKNTFNKVRNWLLSSNISLGNFFTSFTNSNSLFFRFSPLGSDYEIKLETFYDFDLNDESDIEATAHIYKSGTKIESHYGSTEYLFGVIEEILSIPKATYWR